MSVLKQEDCNFIGFANQWNYIKLVISAYISDYSYHYICSTNAKPVTDNWTLPRGVPAMEILQGALIFIENEMHITSLMPNILSK